ncbi:MAG: hypothetical protein E6G08_05160 [Actinobacteria bacterium]|nr:MAG: hypothetical protein E6G08_05160 [Actinomycetota bacterium]
MTKTRRSGKHSHGLRALLALAALAVAGLTLGASSASAATPCWKQVLNDWFVDGRIDNTYPIACYTQAQQHLGEDAVNYSGAPDDIHRALLAAIRQDRGGGGGGGGARSSSGGGGSTSSGGGSSSSSSSTGGGRGTSVAPPPPRRRGPIQNAIDWLGPSNAESIPLPLLILAGIALLLLAAAAASFVARRIQARRLRPVPTPPKQP